MARGTYVVIEGADGTGKSTQLALLAQHLAARGVEYVEFSEPEGTPISNEIRAIIKNGSLARTAETNLLLFTAARHEIWRTIALPALETGKWVIASRNYFSTLVYQGAGEGLDQELITSLTRRFTDGRYITPDRAVILTLPETATRMERINQRGALEHPDTFEARDEAFQASLHHGYVQLARTLKLPTVDASRPIEAVFDDVIAALELAS